MSIAPLSAMPAPALAATNTAPVTMGEVLAPRQVRALSADDLRTIAEADICTRRVSAALS